MTGWPADLREAVFLARAVDAVGRALHRDMWSGEELGALLLVDYPPPVIPVSIVSLPMPPRSIVNSDFTSHAELERRRLARVENAKRDELEYAARYTEVSRINDRLRELLVRKHDAAQRITLAAEAGDLTIYALVAATGDLEVTPRGWWRAVDLAGERFNRWRIDRNDPMKATQYPPPDYSWLFVERTTLAGLMTEIELSSTPPQDWWPLPTEMVKSWCVKPLPDAEANRRAKATVSRNPSEKAVCKALAIMWEEARREAAKWTSIEQYRSSARR